MNIEDLSLAEIQARILGGEHFTEDEYRRVIETYRGDRRSAAVTSTKARAPKQKVDFDLLGEIDAVMGK
jgi:hypothetical protein